MTTDPKIPVEAWLTLCRSPKSAEIQHEAAKLQNDLLQLQQSLQQVHATLARHPDRHEEAQSILQALLTERRRLVSELGLRAFEWFLQGGHLDFSGQAPSDDAGAPPSEPAPSIPAESSRKSSLVPPELEEAPVSHREPSRETIEPPRPVAEPKTVSPSRQRAILHELMTAIGEPRDVSNTIALLDEVDALTTVTEPARLEKWALLSKTKQQIWIAHLVARTRSVKETGGLSIGYRRRLAQVIATYPSYTKAHAPGHVNGLRAVHEPERDSWADDAEHFWQELKEVVADGPLDTSVGEDEPLGEGEIPEDWPLYDRVRAQRAVLVGGEPDEPKRERLELAFDLGELAWVSEKMGAGIAPILGQIQSGKVNLVLILAHRVSSEATEQLVEACKSTGTPWALVAGSDVGAVRQGLEHFLADQISS